MATTINGVTYRNLQEQVAKNKEDIEALQNSETIISTWGNIEGTLSNQTDLQDALDAKADLSNTSQHIITGSLAAKNGTVSVADGDNKIVHLYDDHLYRINYTNTYYNSLPSKNGTLAVTADIPTKTSDLTNDSGFITNSAIPTLYLKRLRFEKEPDVEDFNQEFTGTICLLVNTESENPTSAKVVSVSGYVNVQGDYTGIITAWTDSTNADDIKLYYIPTYSHAEESEGNLTIALGNWSDEKTTQIY